MKATERISAAASRVLLAGALLWISEVVWLLELRSPLDPGKLLTIAATLLALVLAAELVVGGLAALGARLAGPWIHLLFAAVAAPFAWLAAQSLFSGGFIKDVAGVGFMKLGFGLFFVAGVVIAGALYRRLAARPEARFAPLLGGVAAVGVLVCGYLDTHVQVGLYVPAHLILAALGVTLASLAARLLVRPVRLPLALAALALCLVVAAPIGTALGWNSIRMLALISNSNALMPKVRESVVAVRAALGGSGESIALDLPEVDPAEFVLAPSRHPEIDALRGRIRNVVFVLVDAMRDDHVGLQRAGRSITPFLDAFTAEDGVRFDVVYSPSDRTGQSMPALMTSYPFPVVQRLASLQIPMRTWIDELSERGVLTFANGKCDYVNRKYSHMKVSYCFGAEIVEEDGNQDEDFADDLIEFIEERGDRPFAAYTHWKSAHVNENYEDVRDVYADAIEHVDGLLSQVMDALRRTGRYDETLVVLTADHGYSLGDSNRLFSNQCCIEEQMRVPLIMRVPGLAGVRIDTPVAGTDIVPTLLDLLAPDSGFVVGGHSLLPLLYANGSDVSAAGPPAVSSAGPGGAAPRSEPVAFAGARSRSMVRRGPLKLVVSAERDTTLAYDLTRDPREVDPISDEAVIEPLDALLADEVQRQARLLAVLVGQAHPGVPMDVLAILLREDLEDEDVAPLLVDFWDRSSAVRRETLRTILVHRLRDTDHLIEAAHRPGQFEEDDQILLVMRAWSRSASACNELEERYDELGQEARWWLAQSLEKFPGDCARQITPVVLADAQALWAQEPGPHTREAHWVMLSMYGVAKRLKQEAPREVKELLADIYVRFREVTGRYGVPSWRLGRLDLPSMLTTMARSVRPDEFDIFGALPWGGDIAKAMAKACLNLDDPACRAYLLGVLEEREGEHAFEVMMIQFEDYGDAAFRREANLLIQAKYPQLRELGDGSSAE